MTRIARPALVLASCAWIALLGQPTWSDRTPENVESVYDCAILALCTLLRLEGRPISLDHLAAIANEGNPDRRSLKAIREASRRCGLHLVGSRLEAGRLAPDRPALVFMDKKPHGHYLVIRPVGHSGRLVQVIDSGRDPIVMDADDLYRSPEWTGIALVPFRPNWMVRIAGVTVLFATLIVFVRRWILASKSPSGVQLGSKSSGGVL